VRINTYQITVKQGNQVYTTKFWGNPERTKAYWEQMGWEVVEIKKVWTEDPDQPEEGE